MRQKQKTLNVDKILEILDSEFPSPPVPLNHTNAYTLLVAVLLSAQCTDERVNLVTVELFKKADNPKDMVRLGLTEIERIVHPCGFYRNKSRFIYGLSELLLKDYGGEVPSKMEEMEKLPGIGHKSASVVASQFFGQPAFAIDTHVSRLALRWGITKQTNVLKIERDCKNFFPKERWGKVHLQMIYFARKYCPARGHKEERCPICSKLS